MDSASFKELVDTGVAAHQAGRINDALTAYKAAIGIQPEDAEVASLMGLALSESAWPEQALAFLARAVRLEPDQLPFRLNLVEGLERLGQLDVARQEARAVIARDAGNVRAWEKVGDTAAKLGDIADAQAAWTQAQMLSPESPSPALKLAQLAALQGEASRAHAMLDALEERLPTDGRVQKIRCDLLAAQRNWPKFAATVERWLQQGSADSNAWRALSRLHFEAGRFRESANAFGRVLALTAPNASDYTAFAGLCLHALDMPAASSALEQAERLDPEHSELLATRALLSLYQGRFGAAVDDCLRCLAKDPTNVPAAATLSRVQRGQLGDREFASMRLVATDALANLDQRIPASFIVAHALDARGADDESFAAYRSAHVLAQQRDRMESLRFEASALAERRARLVSTQLAVVAEPRDNVSKGTRPIFIVGMPRSGTTLIEAVVAAHPRVFGCGERLAMPPIVEALLAKDTGDRQRDDNFSGNARRSYLTGLPSLGSADHFTDKQPFNFEAVGLIARLFPEATIIYVRRNPLETCLSIYRQEFNKAWTFVHELSDIAAVYEHHALLMREWQLLLPGRFKTIQYEPFVADFESEARGLITACGLEWDASCLDFQRAERPIATFSAVEARDPVSSRNVRVARYRGHLQPLIQELVARGIDLETGALASQKP